jgi:hypothetical protein
MAIALHVSEAKHMDYNFRSFEHTKWPNYSTWKILSVTPKFCPPSAMMTDSPGSTTVDPTNHPVPLLVSLSNKSSPVDTVLLKPTIATNPVIASVVAAPPDSISMQALLNQTRDVQNEIMLNQMKHQYPLGAEDLSLSDLDPSNGGHGALMGNKKARRELHHQSYESEKLKHLDQIERNIEHQTKQNGGLSKFSSGTRL